MFFFNLYVRLINAFSFRHAFLFDTALIICKTKVSCMTLRTCIYWPIDPNAKKCTISVLVLIVAFFLYSEMSEHCHCACLLPHCICLSCLKTQILLWQYNGSSLYSLHTGKGNSVGWPQLFKRRTAATMCPLCKSLSPGKLVGKAVGLSGGWWLI